jgi:ATP-dependent helicase/nuclease subunit B
MSVRFVIGRAGSGKTVHCLGAIRAHLADASIDGSRLILLVPEQAALQMERAILAPGRSPARDPVAGAAPGAVHRAEVLSFRRLAFRVLESAGGPVRFALTEAARAMVVRRLLNTHAGRLRYFRRARVSGGSSSQLSGTAERIGTAISELIHEAISPDQLVVPDPAAVGRAPSLVGAEGNIAAAVSDGAQEAMLHDLRLLYEAYLAYLGTDYLDPSQHLEAARARLAECAWLNGAEFWVDGFASLSGQELLMLIELARRAGHMDVTVLLDPAHADGGVGAGPNETVFARTERTYREIAQRLRAQGVEIDEPLVLTEVLRFRRNASLAALEANWCLAVANPRNALPAPRAVEHVELLELPHRRLEVEYAVSRVVQWVNDEARGYRYRDLALIVRDLEPYHELLVNALRARNIPYFIDRRRPIAHHPLVELLRAGPALAGDDVRLDTVRLLLKTGLLPLESEAADEVENYLLANAIQGSEAWRGADWRFPPWKAIPREEDELSAFDRDVLTRVNRARGEVWAAISSWMQFAQSAASHPGPEWASALIAWMTHLGVDQTLAQWARNAERDGEVDRAEEHRQVWQQALSLLDDLGFAFANESLFIRDFGEVLEVGLSGLTLGLAPPTVDSVLVSAVERSRHPDIKAAVILGFNDGVFPARPSEDPILHDDSRALLQRSGVRIRGGIREQARDEGVLLYIALTRASEALVVTYAAADEKGGELRESPYLEALCAACGGLAVRKVHDPVQTREAWDVLHERDLLRRIATEFRGRPPVTEDPSDARVVWNELYERFRGDLISRPTAARAMRGLAAESRDELSSLSVGRLYPPPLRSSVSQLESYATCPFQHFARYGLRLTARDEADLEPVDIGRVHHAILEDFLTTLISGNGTLGALSDEDIQSGLAASYSRVAENLPETGALLDARNAYLLRRARTELMRILAAQKRIAQAGRAKAAFAEFGFGFDAPGGVPALRLHTPGGKTVLLRGYIDRVDLVELADEALGVVIDYKRTRDKRLDLTQTFYGVSLQLLAYLLVLENVGRTPAGRPIEPLAALFVSLLPRYEAVRHPSEALKGEASLRGVFRPRGLIRADAMQVLDPVAAGGKSAHYAVAIRKDGEISNADKSDAADAGSFRAALAFTRRRLGELADSLLSGDVSVSPYRLGNVNPCSWCPMISVCRFDWGLSNVRFLDPLGRGEALRRMREAVGTQDSPTRPTG